MKWTELIPENEIKIKVTDVTVKFAEKFGTFLGTDEVSVNERGRSVKVREKLTTSQLRKFFGEVKRQQMTGYDVTDFVLLKPKLAYAVGRATKNAKIEDFYFVLSNAIDKVNDENQFKNFIKIFEAIVAYHKKAEATQK